jgi:uncharacterized protein YecE (DUF72 family)
VAPYIGSAGWNIPRLHRERFAADGSQLQRYASRLNAAEINSSFYRPHATAIYQRWAAVVPASFRFSVKIPKLITHERALTGAREPLTRFLGEIDGLGNSLGPLLVQLPPSFAFDARRVGRFFGLLRRLHAGPVVCEPRHASWTLAGCEELLASYRIARVAADPPRAAGLETPGGWKGLVYYRWHGSPRPYFSPYSPAALDRLRDAIAPLEIDAWCIFDNTGSGAAAGNALDLTARLPSVPPHRRTPDARTPSPVESVRVGRRRAPQAS